MSSERDRESLDEPEAGTAVSPGAANPRHLYVNYLVADHKADIHAYWFPLGAASDVQAAVEIAVQRIKQGEAPVAGSPRDIKWKHYSYIAFVLDDATERLTGVEFAHEDSRGNHTFSGEGVLNDFGTHSGVYYVNERKNKDGNPLKDREEELYYWKGRHSLRNGSRSGRAHENSGTNLGP